MIRQTFSFKLARSMKSLFNQMDFYGIYFADFLLQLTSSIYFIELKGTEAGKILKMFVCEITDIQIAFSGRIM